jgi:transposase
MSYLGVVPSEFSTGKARHQGSITKSGNKHARRIPSRQPGAIATAPVSAVCSRCVNRGNPKPCGISPGVRSCV